MSARKPPRHQKLLEHHDADGGSLLTIHSFPSGEAIVTVTWSESVLDDDGTRVTERYSKTVMAPLRVLQAALSSPSQPEGHAPPQVEAGIDSSIGKGQE